jgi:peptide chain release factor 1
MNLDETIDALLARYAELDSLLSSAAGTTDPRYPVWVREHGRIRDTAERCREFRRLEKGLAEAREILADPSADAELKELARQDAADLETRVASMRDRMFDLLEDAADTDSGRNAILEISAAVGGEEAALFAGDLYRMLRKFIEKKGWKAEVLDTSASQMGGIRSLTMRVEGTGAYGALRWEGGGHRVQRVPVTEAQGRIHTSLASVVVLTEIDDVDIKIEEKDIEMTSTHSQGPGGQSVNTTNSAVRIIHKPTGINIKCQEMKSYFQNRDRAMGILRAKLYEIELAKRQASEGATRAAQRGRGDRNDRIRTYNFPQSRVTDHRLEGENKNYPIEKVIDGGLETIHEALREQEKAARRK